MLGSTVGFLKGTAHLLQECSGHQLRRLERHNPGGKTNQINDSSAEEAAVSLLSSGEAFCAEFLRSIAQSPH